MMALSRSACPAMMRTKRRAGCRVLERAVLERLGEPLDGRDRRLELVRDVGDEVAAHGLETLEPRDVVEHDDGAGRAALDVRRSSVPLACRERSSAPTRMTMSASTGSWPSSAGLDDALQVGVADDLLDALALGCRRVDVEQARGGVVERDHALVGVDGDDALDHAGEHRLALVALAGERADLLVQFVGHVVEALGHRGELARARHVELVREVAGGEALRRRP